MNAERGILAALSSPRGRPFFGRFPQPVAMGELKDWMPLVIFDLACVFLYSGIIFGWAPLHQMLVKEGFYAELCEGEEVPCAAMENKLNSAFTLASSAVSVIALPAGWFVDTFGPMAGIMIAGVLQVISLTGIGLVQQLGDVAGFDLFAASLVSMSMAGAITMFCGYTVPFLFPKQATLLIAATSCLFDGSCVIFAFWKPVWGTGIAFSTMWFGYAVLAIFLYSGLAYFWYQARGLYAESKEGGGGDDDNQVISPLAALPLNKQICTGAFLAVMLYAAIQVSRSNLYLGTVELVVHAAATSGSAPASKEAFVTMMVG